MDNILNFSVTVLFFLWFDLIIVTLIIPCIFWAAYCSIPQALLYALYWKQHSSFSLHSFTTIKNNKNANVNQLLSVKPGTRNVLHSKQFSFPIYLDWTASINKKLFAFLTCCSKSKLSSSSLYFPRTGMNPSQYLNFYLSSFFHSPILNKYSVIVVEVISLFTRSMYLLPINPPNKGTRHTSQTKHYLSGRN